MPKIRGRWYLLLALGAVVAAALLYGYRQKQHPQEIVTASRPDRVRQETVAVPSGYAHKNYTSTPAVPPLKASEPHASRKHGSVAIIIDDMGSSLGELKELLSINLPLTFSVIPGLAKSRAVAAAAKNAGAEVMVHLPMEPQGYPKQRLEENGLLVSYSAEEITTRTEALIASLPDVAGANNHMGSRYTEQEDKMLPVLTILKEKELYFIDSRTSPRSIGFESARKLGVRTASRNVFLDNEQDVVAIKRQLAAAARLSRVKGGVIAICHPHPATIQALKEGMPELKKSGIQFVKAGYLVR